MSNRASATILSCLPAVLFAQQMPYPTAYTFVAATVTADARVSATSVADTYGQAGHTVQAFVEIKSPDGRFAWSHGPSGGYYSQATAYLDLCAWGTCWDGLYLTANQGVMGSTQEFCPISSSYVTSPVAQQNVPQAPFVINLSVTFNPTTISQQGQQSILRTTVQKSINCTASVATVELGPAVQSGDPDYTYEPNTLIQGAAFGGANTASVDWTFRKNAGSGTVVAGGAVTDASPCVVPQTQCCKQATLTVD